MMINFIFFNFFYKTIIYSIEKISIIFIVSPKIYLFYFYYEHHNKHFKIIFLT